MDLTMMERVGDREEKMEGSCSTGQSPQWAPTSDLEAILKTEADPVAET
jgi:hypothetical protein